MPRYVSRCGTPDALIACMPGMKAHVVPDRFVWVCCQDYDDSCDDSEDDYEPMRYNPPSRRRNRTSTAHPRVTSLPVASSQGAAEEAAPARSKSKEASAAASFIAASAASKSAEEASEADSPEADSLELTSDESVSGAETRVPHSPASSDSCRYSQFMYLDVCDCSSCEEYRRERWNSRRAHGMPGS